VVPMSTLGVPISVGGLPLAAGNCAKLSGKDPYCFESAETNKLKKFEDAIADNKKKEMITIIVRVDFWSPRVFTMLPTLVISNTRRYKGDKRSFILKIAQGFQTV